MESTQPQKATSKRTCVDFLVTLLNIWYNLRSREKFSNFSFANIYRDASRFAHDLSSGQFFKVYGRHTSRYKYHPLQRFQNSVRKFDVTDVLAEKIDANGNAAFYHAVCSEITGTTCLFNNDPDLQKLDSICTYQASGDYLYQQCFKMKGTEVARLARYRYLRGYSRVINVDDHADWQEFRNELRAGRHVGAQPGYQGDEDAMLFAISYKGDTVKITRRMYLINEDGSRDDGDDSLIQESKKLTSDLVDDFRWSQIIRSCKTIAAKHRKSTVRIWLDRLVMMETPLEERKEFYEVVDWEDFGLFPYVVCPVVRVYDRSEVEFGTDFWRKLESVLGVAGKGLIVDDYMLRQFDKTIYYGPSLYSFQLNGLAVIGGGGVYVRGVTLALATAVLTDSVVVAQANEDIRTINSSVGWKAWALRTIAEGAYSANHSFMMVQEKPLDITLHNFKIISFWESLVSRSPVLTGNSYMDMSMLRSSQYFTSSLWDGVVEWVGMMKGSCQIRERESIMNFLAENVVIDMYASTTQHVASILWLTTSQGNHKRTLVVDFARHASAENGQVTAVAEGTGLWEGSVLPKWYKFLPDPDVDQKASICEEKGVIFSYTRMAIVHDWSKYSVLVIAMLAILCIVLIGRNSVIGLVVSLPGFAFVVGFLLWCVTLWPYGWKWPWFDASGIGEELFDNLLKHAVYDSGIKSYYRRLKSTRYEQIGWF